MHRFRRDLKVVFLLTTSPFAAAFTPAAGEPEDLRVLPAESAGEELRSYLLAECGKHFDARRKAVAKLETAEAVLEHQAELRSSWLAALGPFPERTPLNARVLGSLQREGYRIEKVLYESRPSHHVTAALYLPDSGQGRLPGVLFPCGHDATGKAAAPYQSLCISLAKHGFAVLCYDPIGQGERFQTLDPDGVPLTGGTTEHTLVDVGARLVALSAAHYRVWDGLRSLDYLASRSEVDPERLGCTGNSGGGTLTAYLMATDDRILAAVPSCYITSLERLFATIGPQDGEQNITNQVALGINHAEYILLRAPRPTLINAATKDFFDIGGTWDSFREAKRLYGILGHGERVDIFEFPDTHGYSKPRREAALRWMQRWLQAVDGAAVEPEHEVETAAELRVTSSGQVLHEFRGTSVWDLNLLRARDLASGRESFWRGNEKEKCLAEVRRLCGMRSLQGKPSVREVQTIQREGHAVRKLAIERAGEVPLPALLLVPGGAAGKLPGVLVLDSRGKAREAGPGGALERLVRGGAVVLSVDLRGYGETFPRKPERYWHAEYPFAHMAIQLGRPLLGQRVEDALAALEVLAALPEVDPAHIRLSGIEHCGPVALHAAALDERIREVTLERSIESWLDVVATPLSEGQLPNVVPGALERYDLPDLARAIRPRAVRVLSPADARGKLRGYSIPLVDLAGQAHRQVVVDKEAGQYLGHPTTVLLEDGKTLLAVYPKGHGRGAVVFKKSTDGGLTWSDRLPVPENWATSQEVPTLYRVADPEGGKRLIMFSGLFPIRMASSEDDGATWSPLEPIGDFGGVVAMASVVALKDRSLMALFHDDGRFLRGEGKHRKFQVFKTISKDGGRTWSQPRAIAEHPQAHLCEPGAVRSPDGRQIAVLLRENSRKFNSFAILSSDEGETWTKPVELPGSLTGDRHTARYAPDGRLFITFRDTTRSSPTHGDWVGWVGTYDDIVRGREGQYRVRLMDNTKGADCAYPGLELLPDGTFVTTTYGHWIEGEAPFIASVRFRLEEIDALAKAGEGAGKSSK